MQLPGAWLVVNRWPMLPKHPRRPKADAYTAQLPRERILCRLGESAAADRFTEPDREPWTTPRTRVISAARACICASPTSLGRAATIKVQNAPVLKGSITAWRLVMR